MDYYSVIMRFLFSWGKNYFLIFCEKIKYIISELFWNEVLFSTLLLYYFIALVYQELNLEQKLNYENISNINIVLGIQNKLNTLKVIVSKLI